MAVQMLGEKNRLDRNRIDRNLQDSPELFDESMGYDDETGIKFAPGLTALDRRRATLLYSLFNELWGLCIVKGDPGTGKDLFGNYLSYTVKRYFPWKRILRDEKPRKLYGPYAGLFNEDVLRNDLKTMRKIATGKDESGDEDDNSLNSKVRLGINGYGEALEKAADDWVQGAGEVLLKNSLLYLTEFWKYCYNREPHNPMNKTMGAIHKVKRHLDCLILGTVQLPTELDKKTCLPWVDWEVTCTKSVSNMTGFVYYVQKVKYDRRLDMLIPLGRPFPMPLDAGKPRSELGDGKIRITEKGWHYRPENEEERIVLDVLKSGVDTYEGLVGLLEEEGDMTEREILDTVKLLGLKLPGRRPKMTIDYPCYYRLYNSKSAPNLRTGLKSLEDG